jgi:hypothetical protein
MFLLNSGYKHKISFPVIGNSFPLRISLLSFKEKTKQHHQRNKESKTLNNKTATTTSKTMSNSM